ncbi:MAG: hypothetical protein WDK96_02085 [Candidatus Paceibacterota bacterium]|jgi:predicted negative regulator of RcsB-dependent stress response
MEEKLSFENIENKEQHLINLLKEKGVGDFETKNLLNEWIIEQEKQVEKDKNPNAVIELNLRRARLYFKSGYKEEALENFKDALTQAWNEHKDELYGSILNEMDKLGF